MITQKALINVDMCVENKQEIRKNKLKFYIKSFDLWFIHIFIICSYLEFNFHLYIPAVICKSKMIFY